MKNKLMLAVSFALLIMVGSHVNSASAALGGPNYWTLKETVQLHYEGYLQFQASYKSSAGHVRQGYAQLSREGAFLNREYTPTASSKSDTRIHWAKVTGWDSLNPWAPKTKFNYNYFYF